MSRARITTALTLALLATLACGKPKVAESPRSAPIPMSRFTIAAGGAPLAKHPSLRATVHAPRSFAIEETTLGMNEGLVDVTISNAAQVPARLGEVRLAFAVKRGDVELPCVLQAPDHSNDAGTLAPGASFTATSTLGCWTPIEGEYVARAFVAFESEGPSAGGDLAGEASFAIVDAHDRAAHEAPGHPGLFALAGGGSRTLPVGELEPEDHLYRVAVVFVNASPKTLSLPQVHTRLRVYRVGTSIPCAGEVFVRPVPALASGAVHVMRVPVTCLRDKPGDYVVAAHVSFEGEDEAAGFDAGRVRVRVTRDLGIVVPLP